MSGTASKITSPPLPPLPPNGPPRGTYFSRRQRTTPSPPWPEPRWSVTSSIKAMRVKFQITNVKSQINYKIPSSKLDPLEFGQMAKISFRGLYFLSRAFDLGFFKNFFHSLKINTYNISSTPMVLITSNATNQGADFLRAAFQSAMPFQGKTHTRVNKIHGVQAGSILGMPGNMY